MELMLADRKSPNVKAEYSKFCESEKLSFFIVYLTRQYNYLHIQKFIRISLGTF